jgi:hypothetical protein
MLPIQKIKVEGQITSWASSNLCLTKIGQQNRRWLTFYLGEPVWRGLHHDSRTKKENNIFRYQKMIIGKSSRIWFLSCRAQVTESRTVTSFERIIFHGINQIFKWRCTWGDKLTGGGSHSAVCPPQTRNKLKVKLIQFLINSSFLIFIF